MKMRNIGEVVTGIVVNPDDDFRTVRPTELVIGTIVGLYPHKLDVVVVSLRNGQRRSIKLNGEYPEKGVKI